MYLQRAILLQPGPCDFARTHVVEQSAYYIKEQRPTGLIAIDWLNNTIFFRTR